MTPPTKEQARTSNGCIAFSVPGEVRGKGRPRFGNGRTYTDAKTVSYEGLVAFYAAEAMRADGVPQEVSTGALCVTIAARFVPPKSAPRKTVSRMLCGEISPTRRPDLDNIAKVVDSLNGIVWRDDAQIVSLFVRKYYAETAGLDIVIRPYSKAAA